MALLRATVPQSNVIVLFIALDLVRLGLLNENVFWQNLTSAFFVRTIYHLLTVTVDALALLFGILRTYTL